jgi:hypothetical protein
MKDGLIFYQGPVAEIVPHFSKFGWVVALLEGGTLDTFSLVLRDKPMALNTVLIADHLFDRLRLTALYGLIHTLLFSAINSLPWLQILYTQRNTVRITHNNIAPSSPLIRRYECPLNYNPSDFVMHLSQTESHEILMEKGMFQLSADGEKSTSLQGSYLAKTASIDSGKWLLLPLLLQQSVISCLQSVVVNASLLLPLTVDLRLKCCFFVLHGWQHWRLRLQQRKPQRLIHTPLTRYHLGMQHSGTLWGLHWANSYTGCARGPSVRAF